MENKNNEKKLTEEQIKQCEDLYDKMTVRVKDIIEIIKDNARKAKNKFDEIEEKKNIETNFDKKLELFGDMSKQLGIIINSKKLIEELINAILDKKIESYKL